MDNLTNALNARFTASLLALWAVACAYTWSYHGICFLVILIVRLYWMWRDCTGGRYRLWRRRCVGGADLSFGHFQPPRTFVLVSHTHLRQRQVRRYVAAAGATSTTAVLLPFWVDVPLCLGVACNEVHAVCMIS